MTRAAPKARFDRQGLFLVLALLALAVRVAVPNGFMVAPQGVAGGFPLVICTGHGPLVTHLDHKGDSKSRSDAPCAFAGHAVPLTPTSAARIERPVHWLKLTDRQGALDLTPGRGLAAPPPPSQAPPVTL